MAGRVPRAESVMLIWRRLPRPIRYLGCAVFVVAVLGLALANAKADAIQISLDQAQVMRLPTGVTTIIIGNPLIADGSLQAGGLMIVTGKGYGTTNLMALDRGGRVLMDKTVTVGPPRSNDLVVVFKGVDRESYSCSPDCAPRITTLGDTPAYFGNVLGETNARSGAAAASK
jgi:Pilus formation protein N terminal region